MDKWEQNRHRNRTFTFRLSEMEALRLEERVKVSGLQKTQYYIQSIASF